VADDIQLDTRQSSKRSDGIITS